MQYRLYTDPRGARHLLIHFCGWGMDPSTVSHLAIPDDTDLVVYYDYSDLTIPPISWSADYQTATVTAWSLGVWAAEQILPHVEGLPPIDQCIALAGSTYPVHDQWGMPQTVYRYLTNLLNEDSRSRLDRQMCGGRRYRNLFDSFSSCSTERLMGELHRIDRDIESERQTVSHPAVTLPWSRAVVGGRDLIFPVDNLRALWQLLGVPCTVRDTAPHYILADYTSWRQLLSDASHG